MNKNIETVKSKIENGDEQNITEEGKLIYQKKELIDNISTITEEVINFIFNL